MQGFFALLDRLERWGILVCFAGSLVALCISVTTRYVFQRPLTWPDELTTYLFMLMTFLGASAAVKSGQELKVDALYEAFPRWRFGLDVVLNLVRLGVSLTFLWAGWNFLLVEKDMETVTPILQIPNTVIAGMLPLFGLLLALRSLEALWKLWAGRREGAA
ncbi:MAG: TRAP transporter small permease [Deltaproteobacteria bacterium]|nr:TRAP transporter small permease [Deltaproteobacteria bacterium]